MSCLVVFTTSSSLKEARTLAAQLLEHKLAACISILPKTESHYVWKGKRRRSLECLLMIKTRKSLFAKVEKKLRQIHSYEVPEVIASPVVRGSAPYLDWIFSSTS